MENGFIESFNGRLRDECLNVDVFFTLEDERAKLARWQEDYNFTRPQYTPGPGPSHLCGGLGGDCTDRPCIPRITGDTHVSYARFEMLYWSFE